MEDRLLFGGVLFVLFEGFVKQPPYCFCPCTNPAAKAEVLDAPEKLIIQVKQYSRLFGRHISLISDTTKKAREILYA